MRSRHQPGRSGGALQKGVAVGSKAVIRARWWSVSSRRTAPCFLQVAAAFSDPHGVVVAMGDVSAGVGVLR